MVWEAVLHMKKEMKKNDNNNKTCSKLEGGRKKDKTRSFKAIDIREWSICGGGGFERFYGYLILGKGH